MEHQDTQARHLPQRLLRPLRFAVLVTLAMAIPTISPALQSAGTEPKSVDAVQGIVAAFDQHPVVAIAENPHWLKQAGDFYVTLIHDRGFAAKVNDIVVEFGSRNSQPIVDRYIAGENVPESELQQVWRDSTKIMSWESPIYQNLLTTAREVNRSLPASHRLRVLLGDSPIDWQKVQVHADWDKTQPNNNSFSWVIINDVLKQNRKALVILGSNHLTKGGDSWGDPDTTTLVEDKQPGSIFVVLMLNRNLTSPADQQRITAADWKPPALVAAQHNWVGAMTIPTAGRTLQQVADAVLYLGPADSLSLANPDWAKLKQDTVYMDELARRYKIVYECQFDIAKLGSGTRPCQ